MNNMTNNFAPDEKPTRRDASVLLFLSAVGGLYLGGTMGLILICAGILLVILFALVTIGEMLIMEQKVENGVEDYSEVQREFEEGV